MIVERQFEGGTVGRDALFLGLEREEEREREREREGVVCVYVDCGSDDMARRYCLGVK